jgi:hypothetical protein
LPYVNLRFIVPPRSTKGQIMLRLPLIVSFVLAGASAAVACPDFSLSANASYDATGNGLFMPQSYDVVAGGDQDLAACNMVSGAGYFIANPDFSFSLTEMDSYLLEVSVDSGCDAALLVNTASGDWIYDDDSNGNLDPKITIAAPANGRYDVWIGTYDGNSCNAALKMETFLR